MAISDRVERAIGLALWAKEVQAEMRARRNAEAEETDDECPSRNAEAEETIAE